MGSRAAVALALSVLITVVACGGQAAPTATPTTSQEKPTPTPGISREWVVEEVRVDGRTVTVEIRVFAGIDVRVSLDGRDPDEVIGPEPTLRFVFRDVAPGSHLALVRDAVGFEETLAVEVE